MTDKELKKMSRKELLEMLIQLRAKADELQKELDKTKAQLEDKKFRIENSGSIAEASLAVTNIFREAQKAASLYLENIK